MARRIVVKVVLNNMKGELYLDLQRIHHFIFRKWVLINSMRLMNTWGKQS